MSAIDWVFTRFGGRYWQADGGSQEILSPFLVAGPISLLATLCLANFRGSNLDLAIASAIGLALCFSLRARGLAYALLLLGIAAVCKHAFFLDRHLWQLGIESSVAIGFVLCFFSAESLYANEESLREQKQAQMRSVRGLEEELQQIRTEALEEKMALQERLAAAQKQAEESFSQLSSLQILNDVLRKSCAKREGEALEFSEKERQIARLVGEIEELSAKPQTCDLQKENERLLHELNMARVEREQTYLINETLVRMHAAADRKAKEAVVREKMAQESEDELQQEREKMSELLEQRMAVHQEQLGERDKVITLFQERVHALTQTQALYFQLKKQFEEKNEILHQTRKELFLAQTALEAGRMEQQWEEMEFPLFESMLVSEVAELQEEKLYLESENSQLSEIIGLLSKGAKPKKKKRPSRKK